MARSSRNALIVPSLLSAAWLAYAQDHDRVLSIASGALLALWLVTVLAVGMRWMEASHTRRGEDGPSSWARLDILTGTGRSLMWAGAGAIVLGSITGWASASVLGVLGLATVYGAVTWTAIAAGSDAAWHGATIARTFAPESPVEGDVVREHVQVAGVRIPPGMRLFGAARALPHGPTTRYALGAEHSRAQLELEAELGPAPRGEHRAAAMTWWLGDVLGIARGPFVQRGDALLLVLPRPRAVDGARDLLGAGRDAATTMPTQKLPTEGTFRVREYATGDDTRRIHWVRSLQTDRLMVRLPDEIPVAQPRVRVVLDTQLWGAHMLTCVGSDQLLDALVGVWLGVGKALAQTGTRVTMVAAIDMPKGPVAMERAMNVRSPRKVLELGARARWQDVMKASALVEPGVRHVIVTARPQVIDADVAQIVVPEASWTSLEPQQLPAPGVTLPYPIGSADNRPERRRADKARIAAMWRDRAILAESVWSVVPATYVALPRGERVALEAAS